MTVRRETAAYSEPTILYLSQVLNQVREGSLRVPRFQRPFIWLEERQLELLRSIREGIPVGAIMVWRTTDAPVEYYRKLGRFSVAMKPNARPQQYLLDGVQRITTLYGALTPWLSNSELSSDEDVDDSPGESPGKVAFFSFPEDDFLFADAKTKSLELLPLSVVLDTIALIKYQRMLTEAGFEQWVEQCDFLASAFREYKLPLIPITTDDLSIATLTFQRINTQGAKMSDMHMVHALTWSKEFDLQNQLLTKKEEFLGPLRWEEVEDEVILKVCKGLRQLNLYKTEPKEVSRLIREEPQLVSEAILAVAWAAKLLKERLNIFRPDQVPYSFQIVFLALARDLIVDGDEQNEVLVAWFWFTTYAEAFSGMSDDRVRQALNDFKLTLSEAQPIWSNTKKTFSGLSPRQSFDFRSVRSKATVLALARHRTEISGRDAFQLLGEYGRHAIHQLYLRDAGGKNLGAVGNRVLIHPDEISTFRTFWEVGFSDHDELRAHFLATGGLVGQSLEGSRSEIISSRGAMIFEYESRFADRTAGWFAQRALAMPSSS